MLSLGFWNFLEASLGEGVCRTEILTACNQCILGGLLLMATAVPAGFLQLSIAGTLLPLAVWVAVARRSAVGRKRAEEHLAEMLANEATREADPSDLLDLIAQAESAAEAAGMPRSAVHRAVRESRQDPRGSR